MKVLCLGLSPTILVEDEAAAYAWLRKNVPHADEGELEFLKAQWRWIEVLTLENIKE